MKCDQCDRPYRYKYEDGSRLCLHCHHKEQEAEHWRAEANFKQQLVNMAMINQACDDMEATVGFSVNPNRIPVAQIALAGFKNTKMTNIQINDSQIGVLNTGDLSKIDAVVTLTQGTDTEGLGAALKSLTEAVVASTEIDASAKRDIGELLAALSDQVGGKRSKPVALGLLKGIEDRVSGVNSIFTLVQNLTSVVQNLF